MAEIKSGRVKKTPPTNVSAGRYEFLSLSEAEPDLGVPPTSGFVLASTDAGVRSWVDPNTFVVTTTSPQGNSTTLQTNTSQTTASSPQVIDSTVASAIKYLVYATNASSTEVTEILAVVRGSSVSHVEYGRISLNEDIASYDVTVSGSALQLRATPSSSTQTTYIISKQILT